MSKSNRYNKEEQKRPNRAALEHGHRGKGKYKEDFSDIGGTMSQQARQALENIKRESVRALQGADLYPDVRHGLPALYESHVDGVHHVNLSHQSQSEFGKAIGFGNRSPFRDPITQSDVLSLSNYWTYLMDGGGDRSLLGKAVNRAVETQPYTKNFYAFFAFAVYNKFVGSEDFRTVLTLSEMPRFDYYRLDNGQRRRMRSSSHIVSIYEALRRSFIEDHPFDFFLWLDKDCFMEHSEAIHALKDEGEALELIVRILVDSEAINTAKWQERRKARQQARPARAAREKVAKEDRQPREGAHNQTAQGMSLDKAKKAPFQKKDKAARNVDDILKEQLRKPPVDREKDKIEQAVQEQREAERLVAALNAPTLKVEASDEQAMAMPADGSIDLQAMVEAPITAVQEAPVKDPSEDDGNVVVLEGFQAPTTALSV